MGMFERMIQNAADRLAYACGSQQAAGRLNLSLATADVRAKWNQYVGRKGIRAPTVHDVSDFMAFQYGVEWDESLVARLAGQVGRGALDMDLALPRIADLLLDSGVFEVHRT